MYRYWYMEDFQKIDAWNDVIRATLIPKHATDMTVMEFIASYLVCRDVRQAADDAKISLRDGKHLLGQPDIYKCVTKLTELSVEKYGFNAHEIAERIKEVAFFDPIDLMNEDGTYKKSLSDVPPEARRVIKKLRVKNIWKEDHNGVMTFVGEIIEYEFWDKLKANELLAREKDAFKKTSVVQHEVGKNARSLLLDSQKRAEDRALSMREVIDVTPPPPPLPRKVTDG